jgi:enamine deaminase RidA (YjgF/YER057c/UK114 family)
MLTLARKLLPLMSLVSPLLPPVRSAMQVAALANPGFLVEIEVTAARP